MNEHESSLGGAPLPEILPEKKKSRTMNSLTLAALGVVFGDIGTSPLYAMREAFQGTHSLPLTEINILGVLSLILWSLILVISIKYLGFVMRADNKGEGGVLALTALAFPPRLFEKLPSARAFIYLGLFGAALLVGDGIITPAISVLSAVEGLEVATPLISPFVIPIALAVLVGLFLSQHFGTSRLGAVFGVVVLVWFATLALLGIYGISENPQVLKALNPLRAAEFFLENGTSGVLVLGAVFLVVTGGEALYADMGHFGRGPIQRGWFFAALPALALNYFGQGAVLLTSPEKVANPFYLMAPNWALYPLVLIATTATVIASQAVISGVFSLTRQAVQLGYAPRFRIVHTSKEEIGQIYIPQMNWILLVLTCWLVLEFKSSSNLAAAYGMAVSATMAITTVLACCVARLCWKWGLLRVSLLLVFFFGIDFVFLWANFSKIKDGGWFPLTVGAIIFTLMTTWRRGRQILAQRLQKNSTPFAKFYKEITSQPPTRVKGAAVFMTGDLAGTPTALLHNVRHNKVLHTTNVFMTAVTEEEPYVAASERVEVTLLEEGFYRVVARYGFMEAPRIKSILKACSHRGLDLKLSEITFFLGREILLATRRPGMAIWREHLFSFMAKNAERATSYFGIPPHQVIEIGVQVEL